MKSIVVGVIVLASLLPTHSAAQRGGFRGGGGGRSAARFSGSFRLPPIRPIPPLAGFNGFNRFGFNRFGFDRFGRGFRHFGNGFDGGFGWGYPLFGDLGYYGGDGYQNSFQNPYIVMPMEESFPPLPPPPPVVPETHDYHWTESGDTEAAYSIVSKDGSARLVVAAWVQGDSIRYITPDGTGGQVALDSVDRAATNRTNAQKRLRLPLPPN